MSKYDPALEGKYDNEHIQNIGKFIQDKTDVYLGTVTLPVEDVIRILEVGLKHGIKYGVKAAAEAYKDTHGAP